MNANNRTGDVKAIAIHLPQFHPVPENDAWWGKGFTEWTNVTKARPLFPGHPQPHLPSDLGFYDMRLPETRAAQAELARQYGISAFCYYHYWFGGKRILERPVNDIVASGEPDFPFCLCWANENWTRTWDGKDSAVLLAQNYGPDDDLAHFRELLPIFSDPRYLRIDGKVAFFVYRPDQLPDARSTVAIWREEARKAGLGELFLGAFMTSAFDVEASGFDVAVEFAPNKFSPPQASGFRRLLTRAWCRIFARLRGTRQAAIHLYDDLARGMTESPPPAGVSPDRWLRCVTPGWDNSARKKNRPLIFVGSTPERYGRWLREMVAWTRRNAPPERRFIFINAWNEWAEGNHLEPDQRNGHANLEATARALDEGNRDAANG
ncbi:polysaccharide biosynthesis protein [Novosphingobium aromaticivorans DSM 12444]|uniref:Polysaccharide biosynthesis protein n=1 Tax=Novosphingobium aromaticivorans (strain ATCC 700278 / DSM 12444 / CCUG 56034 / CIP 105152 / NBRC 16084 / F199) TaxID=279238 RepID=Q2G3A4_NOVAD|nr:glycoside hydrolase family 99-like domain-containing protein [Novosphingobium aromaticivorans]ABD27669.1 polysaccharide biosynthesis protein [Novosphingobium aromaticivorans DSM 12444]SCY30929.1 Glycosyltransferase WbsX [Novosphingobium aromaticivorans]